MGVLDDRRRYGRACVATSDDARPECADKAPPELHMASVSSQSAAPSS